MPDCRLKTGGPADRRGAVEGHAAGGDPEQRRREGWANSANIEPNEQRKYARQEENADEQRRRVEKEKNTNNSNADGPSSTPRHAPDEHVTDKDKHMQGKEKAGKRESSETMEENKSRKQCDEARAKDA